MQSGPELNPDCPTLGQHFTVVTATSKIMLSSLEAAEYWFDSETHDELGQEPSHSSDPDMRPSKRWKKSLLVPES